MQLEQRPQLIQWCVNPGARPFEVVLNFGKEVKFVYGSHGPVI